MRLIIDTQAIVWFSLGEGRLSRSARNAIVSADERFVSAATIWEIATKFHAGRWPEAAALLPGLMNKLRTHGFEEAPVTSSIAEVSAGLPRIHADPFDRLIIATAMVQNLDGVVSSDRLFRDYPINTIW